MSGGPSKSAKVSKLTHFTIHDEIQADRKEKGTKVNFNEKRVKQLMGNKGTTKSRQLRRCRILKKNHVTPTELSFSLTLFGPFEEPIHLEVLIKLSL